MAFLYIYLAGVIASLLMQISVKWLRPLKTKSEIDMFILMCIFSWITIGIVIYVVCDSWIEERDIMRNFQMMNKNKSKKGGEQ